MILMFLGSLALMLFGWQLALNSFQKFCSPLHKTLLEQKAGGTVPLIFRSVAFNFLMASSRSSQWSAVLFWNLGLKQRRESILRICLAPLSLLLPLAICSFYLGLSGYLFLGVAFFGFFSFVQKRTSPSLWPLLTGLGLFLVGSELSLRQAPVVLNLLSTHEGAFFLADGRFGAVFFLMLVGFLVSLTFQIEMWSLVIALALLVINVISLNGALGLVVGELLATSVLLAWKTRCFTDSQQKVLRIISLSSLVGALLGFWVAGEFRSFVGLGFDFEFSAFQARILQILVLVSIVLIVQLGVLLTVGHFFAKEVHPDGLETISYADGDWGSDLSPGVKDWLDARVSQRLSEIRYHIQGLDSLPPGKVPEPLQKRLAQEEKQLSAFLRNS